MSEATPDISLVQNDSSQPRTPEVTATIAKNSPLLIFIAYRRGPTEGDKCAQWLNNRLKGKELVLDAGRKAQIQTYFDRCAPAIHDWTQKWKGDLRTARAMILVCSRSTRARRAQADWLYDEIEWWVKHRRTAPILAMSQGDDPSMVPKSISSRWPKAQRINWSGDAEPEEQEGVIQQIIDGLIISERGINYEELRRLKIRNRALLALTLIAGVLAVTSYFFARSDRIQRKNAERNLQLTYGPNLQVAYKSFSQGEITETKNILLAIPAQLRGVEWNVLRNLADQSERTWTEHEDINTLDFSPDGSELVLGRADGQLSFQLINSLSQDNWTFPADSGRISNETVVGPKGEKVEKPVRYPPNITQVIYWGAQQLATTGNDGLVHLRNLSARFDRTLQPSDAPALPVLAVSPDRQWLASAAENQIVHVWQLSPTPAKEPVATFDVGLKPDALAFSGDSKSLVVFRGMGYLPDDSSRYLQLWDWRAQQKLGPLVSDKLIFSICVLGRTLYGGTADGSIVMWDLQTQKFQRVLNGDTPGAGIELMTPSPDGSLLAGVVGKRKIIVWDPVKKHLRTFMGAESDINALRFQPMGHTLVSVSGKELRFYDLQRPEPRLDLPDAAGDGFDVSSNGNTLVTASGSFCRIRNLSSGTYREVVLREGARSIAIFRDGSRFVVGSEDGTIRCYRIEDGTLLWTSKRPEDAGSLALAPDSSVVISGGPTRSGEVFEIWQTQTGSLVQTFDGTGYAHFSADGKVLAAEGYYHRQDEPPFFRVYHFPDMSEIALGPAREEQPYAMALDPRGERLLTVRKEIEMWRLVNPPELVYTRSLQGNLGDGAAFSPDGSRFVVSVNDTLTIWDTKNGDLLLRLGEKGRDSFNHIKWVGNKLYTRNGAGVTVIDADTEGVRDWESRR